MGTKRALAGGAAGAAVLTVLHQALRRSTAQAPKMDVLGAQAIAKSMWMAGVEPPAGDRLYRTALAGDLASNTLFYSIAGLTKRPVLAGTLLGLAAGAGAVLLPGPLGLDRDASAASRTTAALTMALYTAGGLAAGLTARSLKG